MKVLYAFPEPLPLPRARGIQAVHTVAALAEEGVEVDFSFVPAEDDPFTYYAVTRPAGVTLVPLSRSLPWPLGRVHSNRLYAWRLGRRYDLGGILLMVRHLKLAAWLAAHPAKPTFLYEAHEVFSDTSPSGKAAARASEEAGVMRAAAAVVANSRATADRLVELFGQPAMLEVIPNGVTMTEPDPRRDWQHPGEHIIYAGSLFPWKGVDDLVTAASQLPGCRIEIVGGDDARIRQLQSMVQPQGAALNFPGHLPHEAAMRRIASACIAVLPNRPDTDSRFTSPIKLFEYMAAGCAIVVSDLAPMREILGRDDAMWAEPGNPQSLAAAIQALVSDPGRARQMGEKVRAMSRDYTWQARARRLRAILERMAA